MVTHGASWFESLIFQGRLDTQGLVLIPAVGSGQQSTKAGAENMNLLLLWKPCNGQTASQLSSLPSHIRPFISEL